MKLIRDHKGRLIGQVVENGNVTYIRDGQGRPKGQYIKSGDKTYDEQGRYKGSDDQLLRLIN
ncbi:MAG: hypothetical protein QM813_21930 [Verrucomicrobiota bacterium]